jgi:hypothetical protein
MNVACKTSKNRVIFHDAVLCFSSGLVKPLKGITANGPLTYEIGPIVKGVDSQQLQSNIASALKVTRSILGISVFTDTIHNGTLDSCG